MTRVAVVGGGAAGIGAALALRDAGVDVTIFESQERLGGHCFPVHVPRSDGSTFAIDAGVSDFNEVSFTSVRRVLERLGLKWHPVVQDAAFAFPDGEPVWSAIAGQKRRAAPFDDWDRFVADDARFKRECLDVLADARLADWTAARWLAHAGFGSEFVERAFVPRAGGAFPMPDLPPERYLMRSIVAFWHMHGIIGPNPPLRMVLDAGMHAWPDAFARWFEDGGGALRLKTRVVGVARRGGAVRVRVEDDRGRHETHAFDHAVLATSPNFIAGMLEDPTSDEWRAIGGFHWQRARVCVHGDAALVGRDRELRGAYNYVVGRGGEPATRPNITFWANRLATLPDDLPDVFVTVNPHREPAPHLTWANRFFVHPCLERSRERSGERLDALQGEGGIWFAGAWLRAPHVHEQALRTGLEIGERLVERLRAPAESTRRLPSWDDTMRAAPAFVALDEAVLEEARVEASLRRFAAGETLCREGEAADGMYVVAYGSFEVTQAKRVLARPAAGELIGELALLDRGPRTATVTALTDAAAWFLPRDRFESLVADERPAAAAVADQVAREVCHRLRQMLGHEAEPASHAPAAPATDVVALSTALLKSVSTGAIPTTLSAHLLAWPEARTLAKGAVAAHAGSAGDRAWLVLDGTLALESADGRPLGTLGPGALAGAPALLDGGRQPLTVHALEDSVVLVVNPQQFRELRYRRGGAALVNLAYTSLAQMQRSLIARSEA